MKRTTIEGRLAKLEASTGTGEGDVMFLQPELGETLEEFESRSDRLIRESTRANWLQAARPHVADQQPEIDHPQRETALIHHV